MLITLLKKEVKPDSVKILVTHYHIFTFMLATAPLSIKVKTALMNAVAFRINDRHCCF